MAQVLYLKDTKDRYMKELEAEDYLFILKEFHRLLRRTLTPTAYALFCAIEDRAGPGEAKGIPAFTCCASHATLALDMNVKRITVQRTMPLLETAGVVTVEEREGETSFIHPIVSNEQRAAYLLKAKGVNPTCIKLIQATYPNLSQNDIGDMATCINLIQPPVSKRYTKETNIKAINTELITNVINGENSPLPTAETKQNQTKVKIKDKDHIPEPVKAKDPPLDKQGTMLNRFKTAYLAVGSDPANHNKRCGVIGDAWEEITGKKRDYKFIAKVMRDDAKGVGWKVIEALLSMANKDITEDPEGYLRRILQNGNQQQQQQRGPNLAGNGTYSQPAFRPVPKPIKPRGSLPDGGFTREEFLENGY